MKGGDVWANLKKELLIVDYKATSTNNEISLDDEYKQGFKKQMEIYQWIFRQNGFKVNKTGYFVYANAYKHRPKFDGRLEFEVQIIPHKGDDSWVNPTIFEIKKCLESDKMPDPNSDCEFRQYRKLIKKEESN
ncbi:PD-(D/E)XK nuclease family protein [Patescibacteria group bacterium]